MASQTLTIQPADDTTVSLALVSKRSLFLVWGPPSHGPRSRVFARALGIDDLHFVYSTTRRGWLAAPAKYPYQALQTLRLLFARRPRLVFVQSPPSFAVMFVYLYCLLAGAHYIVDAHSAAFQRRIWTRPRWLHRLLARRAITTIVTNEHFERQLQGWGARAFVLRDIPSVFDTSGEYPLDGEFNIAVVNTFAKDEPLGAVLEAARALPDVRFYITGKTETAPAEIIARAPANVRFTGFLPDAAYYALLGQAHAVMCLTTRDNTMQRGACEALSLGRPIITSDWPLLRAYFHTGTVHVPGSADGIRRGVLELRRHYDAYALAIRELQAAQQQEWHGKIAALMRLIEGVVAAR
jgi:glycosyltransferase involved in cell wall biosynthesis